MPTTIKQPKQSARFMQGNEAIAEGALAAGIGFFAAYPITPANEISEAMARELPARGAVFIQMEDEIASMAAVIGASLGGLKAATATSGPGFSLMQEQIGYAVATEIPSVVIDVQRAGPSTGQPTFGAQGDVMQARWGTHGDHPIIVLSPSSVSECFALTVRAFNLAEKYRTPVILLADEVVGHMRERVSEFPVMEVVSRARPEVHPEWYFPYDNDLGDVPPLAAFGDGYRYHVTGLFHDKSGFPTQRIDEIDPWFERLFHKIEGNTDDIVEVSEEGTREAEIVLVSYGAAARSARHAMKMAAADGKRVGLLKLKTLWPLPEDRIKELARSAKGFIVVEMNRGQVRLDIERLAAGRAAVEGVHRFDGEMISPTSVLKAIEEF
ncbi:MAG: 2-oxoacid:acceptor oxidoreductase subunit alpha [Chloroflexi bacterium]|nr:2-oxoacid:acceptor oxidoreductase subunit alpha [Chloroflexota bacterium]